MSPPSARRIASTVLVRVAKDAAFAAAALDAELARAPQLDARDRAFATELVYGALRFRPWLEAQVARHATRGMDGTDPSTRAEMTLAAYQLYFSRVPAFAAVNEAVLAVRRSRGATLGRFANAVLRKVAADADRTRAPTLRVDAAWASTPGWTREALSRSLGDEGAHAFLASSATAPPLCLRVERAEAREEWVLRLRAASPGASFEPGGASPLAILVRGAGDVRVLPGFASGDWSIQEEGSQVVALLVGARRGDRVLDACAGRGNKSAVLARAVGREGALDAADSAPDKLERLASELGRLGLSARRTFAVDWSVGSGDAQEVYDRALVDAPCSGIGTLRRRPELLTRRTFESLASLAELQRAVLSQVAGRVREGGRLVYAVCSVLREEAEEVVDAVVASHAGLELAPFEGPLAPALSGEHSSLRLLPHVHGTDGYFLASFRVTRRRGPTT